MSLGLQLKSLTLICLHCAFTYLNHLFSLQYELRYDIRLIISIVCFHSINYQDAQRSVLVIVCYCNNLINGNQVA